MTSSELEEEASAKRKAKRKKKKGKQEKGREEEERKKFRVEKEKSKEEIPTEVQSLGEVELKSVGRERLNVKPLERKKLKEKAETNEPVSKFRAWSPEKLERKEKEKLRIKKDFESQDEESQKIQGLEGYKSESVRDIRKEEIEEEKSVLSKIRQPTIQSVELEQIEAKKKKISERGRTEIKAKEGKEKIEISGIPDFLESILGGKAAKVIRSGDPACIIVQQSNRRYQDLVKIICREIYRERKGGYPEPKIREDMEELRRELEPDVEDQIVIATEVEECEKRLVQTLRSFFSYHFGFLILVSTNPDQLEDEIRKKVANPNLAKIESVEPTFETRDKIVRLVRGREKLLESESFGERFEKAVDDFDRMLKKRYLEPRRLPPELRKDYDKLIARSPDEEEQATDLHSSMKGFVWIWRWEESERKVEPNLEVPEDGTIPDIKVRNENYEVETMFKADPYGKLTLKIRNYLEKNFSLNQSKKVYFVLKNSTILFNLKELLLLKRDFRDKFNDLDIYGINIQESKLKSIDHFASTLRDIF